MLKNILLTSIAVITVATSMAYATDPVAGDKKVTSKGYVDTAVSAKQAKLSGNGANTAVTYPASQGGTPNQRTINAEMGSSTSDTGLATTGAINTALNAKQIKIQGTQNNVVTYGATDGSTGSKAVYQASGSYTSGALAEAGHVNSTVTAGFNAHLTCAQYATANDPTSDCLLWNVNTLSGTYVPHGN